MVQTPGIREHAVLPNPFHRGGDVQGLAPWPPLMSNVKHHEEAVIAEVSTQLSEVVGNHRAAYLEPTLLADICTAPFAVDDPQTTW